MRDDRADAIRWARELVAQGVRIVRLNGAKGTRREVVEGGSPSSSAPHGKSR